MRIAEDFLHFIWKFRLYQSKSLRSSGGQAIEVVHPGVANTHAGPDFSQAKIRIADVLWSGQVEVHMKASEWFRHGHHHDEAYENVILHVVYEHDQQVFRRDGSVVPALVLKDLFDADLLNNYTRLLRSFNHFPCEKQIGQVHPLYINSFLCRLAAERMQQKAADIGQLLKRSRGDWDEVFYILLARAFGAKVNVVPFELLAASIRHTVLYKCRDKPLCIEALIFGQAGFLNQDFEEDYPLALKKEYEFLRKKHALQPISVSLWKFLRMRPHNFPTVRLAQFAAVVRTSPHLLSVELQIRDLGDLRALFQKLPVHPYWKNHYHFQKTVKPGAVQPGRAMVHTILINTVCQVLFAYGKYLDDPEYMDRAIHFLENMEAEKNSTVALYEACGLKIDTAYMSQAILQLNKYYCLEKKCLNCSVGIKILKH